MKIIKLMKSSRKQNEKSNIVFDKRISIKTSHGIDWDHALDCIFGEFGFSSLLLGPNNSKCGVKLHIPVIGLSNNNTGTFSLHNHGIDQVLERFLCRDKFFHDDLIYFVDPVRNLSLLILLSSKSRVNGFIDNFLQLFRRELNLLELFRHDRYCIFTFELIYQSKSIHLISCILLCLTFRFINELLNSKDAFW